MSSRLRFLFSGSNSYIGGTVLNRLSQHPEGNTFSAICLIHSAPVAEKFKSFGVDAVVGSHDSDPNLVEKLVTSADGVWSTIDPDNLIAAKATLRGVKKHFQNTGKRPFLIHTSGTGKSILADHANGEASSTVYDDLKPDQINKLPATQLHRDVDMALLEGDKEGYVRVHVVIPSVIYGVPKNQFVDAGIQEKHSTDLDGLIRAAVVRRRAGMIGAGQNYLNCVHVGDLADLYVHLLDSIRKRGEATDHGDNGFYFAENGECTMYEVAKTIGNTLVELGLSSESGPTPLSQEEVDLYLKGMAFLGGNTCCKAKHAKELGWQPKHSKEEFLASIKPEVKEIAKQAGLLKQID